MITPPRSALGLAIVRDRGSFLSSDRRLAVARVPRDAPLVCEISNLDLPRRRTKNVARMRVSMFVPGLETRVASPNGRNGKPRIS